MATQDYTDYLSKEVIFLTPILPPNVYSDGFQKISGVIQGVVVQTPLETSQFFVDDNTYFFSEVIFIEVLDNPVSERS